MAGANQSRRDAIVLETLGKNTFLVRGVAGGYMLRGHPEAAAVREGG